MDDDFEVQDCALYASFADIEKRMYTFDQLSRQAEAAFRRGYSHGYWTAANDAKNYGPDEMVDFAEDVIWKWRFGNIDKITEPPEITD